MFWLGLWAAWGGQLDFHRRIWVRVGSPRLVCLYSEWWLTWEPLVPRGKLGACSGLFAESERGYWWAQRLLQAWSQGSPSIGLRCSLLLVHCSHTSLCSPWGWQVCLLPLENDRWTDLGIGIQFPFSFWVYSKTNCKKNPTLKSKFGYGQPQILLTLWLGYLCSV